jgi:hypothetical protein
MKIAGHVSTSAKFCRFAPENARHLRMYARRFSRATEILRNEVRATLVWYGPLSEAGRFLS